MTNLQLSNPTRMNNYPCNGSFSRRTFRNACHQLYKIYGGHHLWNKGFNTDGVERDVKNRNKNAKYPLPQWRVKY